TPSNTSRVTATSSATRGSLVALRQLRMRACSPVPGNSPRSVRATSKRNIHSLVHLGFEPQNCQLRNTLDTVLRALQIRNANPGPQMHGGGALRLWKSPACQEPRLVSSGGPHNPLKGFVGENRRHFVKSQVLVSRSNPSL